MAALALIVTTSACGDAGGVADARLAGEGADRGVQAEGPSIRADGGGQADADDGGSDGARPDGGGGGLRAMIAPIVTPHVDPRSALTDLSKTVGIVVAAVGPSASGVYGFGATEANGSRVPDGDTVFQIGSASKSLTGLIFARQVVAATNPLARTTKLDAMLPQLAGANGTRNVTLEMLVTHYSGLTSMPNNLSAQDPFSPGTGYSYSDLRAYLFGLPAPVKAGQRYVYSNTGIGLLGLALEKKLGVSGYDALLRKGMLADLGIREMWGEVAKIDPAARTRVAKSYSVRGGQRVEGHFSQMGVLGAAGETATTGNAMRVLLLALTGRKPSALDAAISEAIKPLEPAPGGEIGYGINIAPAKGGRGPTYNKAGSVVGGYTAYFAFRRSPRVGVALMTNVHKFQAIQTIALAILDKLDAAARP